MTRCAITIALVLCATLSAPSWAITCPEGIGASAGDDPKAIFDMGDESLLLLCGWEEDEPRIKALFKERRVFSEFEVVDSRTRVVALRFDSVQQATVRKSGPILHIIEYKIYPLGADFSYKAVPFSKYKIQMERGRPLTSCELVIETPIFTRQQLGEIDALYQKAKTQGPGPEGEKIAVLVVLAAMGGSSKYQSLLPTASQELRLDGHLSEEFHATRRDWEEVRSGHCGSE